MVGGGEWNNVDATPESRLAATGTDSIIPVVDSDWVSFAGQGAGPLDFHDIQQWNFDPLSIASTPEGTVVIGGNDGQIAFVGTSASVNGGSFQAIGQHPVNGLDVDDSGTIWFADGVVGHLNTLVDETETRVVENEMLIGAVDLALGPDNTAWVTKPGTLLEIGGEAVTVAVGPGAAAATFTDPGGLTVGPDGTVYFADRATGAIFAYRPATKAVEEILPAGAIVADVQLRPVDLDARPDGSLIVVDATNRRLLLAGT